MALTEVARPVARRAIDAISRHRVFRDIFELSLVAVAFLLYFLVRGSVVDRPDEAIGNALDVIKLEKTLGIFWEKQLQEMILGNMALIQLMNAIYFWLEFPLIAVVGIVLYFVRRHEYTVARDAFLLSGAIALVIYHLYPVAPPRLTPGFGFVGTVEEYTGISYQAASMQPFVNPYAAVPSLHFGWPVLLAATLFWTFRHPLIRAFAVFLPPAQLAAIVFTANHYIVDAAAGLAVAVGGLLLSMALQRWFYPRVVLWAEAIRSAPQVEPAPGRLVKEERPGSAAGAP